MRRNRKVALAALAGTLMVFGSCLSVNPQQLLVGAATHSVIEFVLDNDGVFDLFEDGGTAAQ
jgi:hypothetical protein